MSAVMRLAQPLAPQCRDAFLRILAHELRGRADVGDGELHRVAVETIKSYRLFDAPLETERHEPRHERKLRNGVRTAADG